MLDMQITCYWCWKNWPSIGRLIIIIIGQGNFLKETGKSSISFYWILIILLQTTVYTTRLYSYCILKSCRPCHVWSEYWFCKCVFHMCVQLHKNLFFNCREKEMRKILDAFHRKNRLQKSQKEFFFWKVCNVLIS